MHAHDRFPSEGFPGRGRARGRAAEAPPPVDRAEVAGWFAGRLPDEWFTGPVELLIDRDEITVVGAVPEPDAGEGDASAARAGRIARFREQTREQRMGIADAAQARYGRSVAWGARCGDTRELFTTLSVPVMTRLRQPERQVLDTLVDAGVARSRSEALAWSVRLVGEHTEQWLTQLRDAMASVEEVRARGPQLD
ncbi:hypothetical protein SAMN05661080_01521 [Modestobacter sp. DSM 44400]|uniref:hypothetical protein n=1 Tax=Modestobacter sp. DSM 44400 TaxID=1550230 RepID=UPI000899F40F|nr:hypothetical protein [Modestobacter sp. DSM 44400]SDX87189.1 hypothetical protein SAMN05661080_01521 [Modestobacter sp. DSM 44400]